MRSQTANISCLFVSLQPHGSALWFNFTLAPALYHFMYRNIQVAICTTHNVSAWLHCNARASHSFPFLFAFCCHYSLIIKLTAYQLVNACLVGSACLTDACCCLVLTLSPPEKVWWVYIGQLWWTMLKAWSVWLVYHHITWGCLSFPNISCPLCLGSVECRPLVRVPS